ncbi:hypothetical protein D3C87_1644170 [compost metagenome]
MTGLERKLVPWLFDRGDKAVQFQELSHGIGSRTPGTEKMLKQSLDEAIRCGDLVAFTKDGGRRTKGSSIKSDDVLMAGEQRSLIYLG